MESPAFTRFIESMAIDFERWHDGIGFDMAALEEMTPAERLSIEERLLTGPLDDWRYFEALQRIGTPRAVAAIERAATDGTAKVRGAAADYLHPQHPARSAALVAALEHAELMDGLGPALDQTAEYHPPEVIDALFRGALRRESDAAVNMAAMLYYLHGKATEPFDWDHRPFFLRFATGDRAEREAAFRDLCRDVGVPPERYLDPNPNQS
jgi:hypothetical protein